MLALENKRWNEHIKLFAGFLNSLAGGTILGAFIVPAASHSAAVSTISWFIASIATHLVGQASYVFLEDEE